MVLMEEAEVERLRQKQLKEFDPTLSAMVRAQAEIDKVLNSNNLTDEDKLRLLHNAQQNFKKLKSTIGPITTIDTTPIIESAPEAASAEEDVAKSLPKADFISIQKLINTHPKILKANAKDELVFKNRTIRGTSVSQMLDSLLTGKNISQPGFAQFLQGLNLIKGSSTHSTVTLKAAPPRPIEASTPNKLDLSNATSQLPVNSVLNDTKILPLPSPTHAKSIRNIRKSIAMKGKGNNSAPPGKRPRILLLYR